MFVYVRPEQKLARATNQHTQFNQMKHALAQQCHKVGLHNTQKAPKPAL